MKKETIVKKGLFQSLLGIPLGITIMVISYILVYFIVGDVIFDLELNQLHNIDTFITQIISAGIAGYFIFLSFYCMSFIGNRELETFLSKHPCISLFILGLATLFLGIVFIFTLGNIHIFSRKIMCLNSIILYFMYLIAGFVFCIKGFIESYWVKKINQKIQDNN